MFDKKHIYTEPNYVVKRCNYMVELLKKFCAESPLCFVSDLFFIAGL